MSRVELVPPASWRDALRAQIRPTRSLRHPVLWLLLVATMALVAGITMAELREGNVDLNWLSGLVVVGAMGALEWPGQRRYRLTLPVSRPAHALVRAVVRWLTGPVLMTAWVTVASGIGFALAGFPTQHLPTIAGGLERLLAGATVLFLLVYALALHTDRVWLWLTVPFFVFVFAMAVRELPVVGPLGVALERVYASLVLAVVGRTWTEVPFGGGWAQVAGVWVLAGVLAVLLSAALLRER